MSTKSPSKEEINKIVKNYSNEKHVTYKKNGTQTAHVMKIIENCHPSLDGYRENITFCDDEGHPFAKKIVVKCLRCTEVHHKLYPK